MQPASDPPPGALDRATIITEMNQARLDFRRLAAGATAADLRFHQRQLTLSSPPGKAAT